MPMSSDTSETMATAALVIELSLLPTIACCGGFTDDQQQHEIEGRGLGKGAPAGDSEDDEQ